MGQDLTIDWMGLFRVRSVMVLVRRLAPCRDKLSAVIAQLISKFM